MFTPTLAQFSALTESIFDHSPQAVLAITETKVSYANRAAIELLGINPTGLPLINYVDASFATLIEKNTVDPMPKTRRTKFFDHYYDILPILCHGTLLLFLYSPDAAYDKKVLLSDTLLLFESFNQAAKQAFNENKSQALKTILIQSDLAIKALRYALSVSLSSYDFFALLEYAMASFSVVSEHQLLNVSVIRGKSAPTVALDCRLMHAALVGTVFDLLCLIDKRDVLSVSCTNSRAEVTLSFSCQTTKFPKELESLLFCEPSNANIESLQMHGTSLLLSKHIFAIHNAKLQIENSGSGFTLTLSFPCAVQPPTLYTAGRLLTEFPTPFSLSPEDINAFFLNPEKA